MGSLFGSQVNPTPSNPIVGGGTQQMFFNSLYNLGLTPTGGTQNGVPGSKLSGMPAYEGQMTPDLSKMIANNVWGNWSPEAAGTQQLGQLMGGFQQQMNPNAGAPVAGMASGQTQGNPLSFMSNFLQPRGVSNPMQMMQGGMHLPGPMQLPGFYNPGALLR